MLALFALIGVGRAVRAAGAHQGRGRRADRAARRARAVRRAARRGARGDRRHAARRLDGVDDRHRTRAGRSRSATRRWCSCRSRTSWRRRGRSCARWSQQNVPPEEIGLYVCPHLWMRGMPPALERARHVERTSCEPPRRACSSRGARTRTRSDVLRGYRKVDELRMIGKWFDVYRRS